MIEIFFKNIKSQSLEKLENVKKGAWINVEDAKKDDLDFVAEITNLNIIDLEDALDVHELPRIERKSGAAIFFVRDAQFFDRNEDVSTTPLTIVITKKYIITISINKSDLIRRFVANGFDFSTTQRSKFLIYTLLNISRNFTKAVKSLNNDVEYQKDKLEKVSNADILKLIEHEELLSGYISALNPMKIVFEAIETGKYIPLYSYDEDLIEDMIISIRQSVEICSTNLKSIESLRESYQIMFTNNLNKTIRVLTSITVILTIPTMIASFFGMNVLIPLQSHPLGFLFILAISCLISFAFLYVFMVKKWF
ncbi:MAG: magnesium transporter CorA family protein [Candidatus Pacebacteria bacterium]|nr:magnesium transporter CorA family protein [Candidatus Paceibacterota bacterium]